MPRRPDGPATPTVTGTGQITGTVHGRRIRARDTLLALGLFLTVWGGKLMYLHAFDSDLPFWDQWDGIGGGLIEPYLEGRLRLGDIFQPHNEHRIVCTRLLALALFRLNGQWDARVDCVVNAALHAAIAVMVFFWGRQLLGRGGQFVWFLVVAALTAPPVVWENIIRGFDSQQYFLIGFSLAAIALLLTAQARTQRWWAGLACAIIALFTMGSGAVAAAVVIATLALEDHPREVWRRRHWTLLACALIVATAALLHHAVPAHEALGAHTLQEFATAFWHNLQWPLVHHKEYPLIGWAPWCWLAWRCWRRRELVDARERVVFAVGLWALVHYAAQAYTRGSFNPWPAVRSLENVTVGIGVNALALLIALSRVRLTGPARAWRIGAVTVGVMTGGYGLATIIHENITFVLPIMTAEIRRCEASMRAFVLTGDPAHLRLPDIPYPNAGGLAHFASLPHLRTVLPASIRAPLTAEGVASPEGSFIAGGIAPEARLSSGASMPGSFTDAGLAAQGEWRSAPISRSRHAYWRFDLAGTANQPGLDLIVAAADGSALADFTPGASEMWETVTIPAPKGSAVVIARDAAANGWLGFHGPVEVAFVSHGARRLTGAGPWFLTLGLLAAAAGWLWPQQPEKSAAP